MYGHPIEPGGSFALVWFRGVVLFRFSKNKKVNENKVRRETIM